MKISYNWLKNYIDLDIDIDKVSEILTDTGLEVEGLEKVESIKGGLKGVKIGEVLSKTKHPDADKLNITSISVGGDEPLQIVCGAPNVAVGQKVVVATVGTTLYPTPDEAFKIKKSKIRGIESLGMICAEDELGMGASHDGIMVLDNSATVGQDASEFFKIEDDYLIEIGLTPNRADAMGHIGVAKDLKAFLNIHESKNIALKLPEVQSLDYKGQFSISIKDEEACPRYCGAILKNIKVAASPDWLQNRLRTIGLNPVNNIVDITNYVMFETGQPLHAFDLNKVGSEINVRYAKTGESINNLDGVKRNLNEADLVIANATDPMCMAGIFGGEDSGVSDTTTDIFLEAAYFNPVITRKSAKRHGLNTDSSFRFERGVDPNNTQKTLERAVFLLQDVLGAELVESQDLYPAKIENFKVEFNFNRCRQLIGADIDNDMITAILAELDIKLDSKNGEDAIFEVPTYRVDVIREADLIEEVLRIYGFNKVEIPLKLNASISYQTKPNKDKHYNLIADLLVNKGFYEIMNNSLSASKLIEELKSETLKSENDIHLLNPLSNELDIMRRSLVFGGLSNIEHNQNRQQPNLNLFEFGKSYQKIEDKYIETESIGIWITGNQATENWNHTKDASDFFRLKGIVDSILSKLGLDKNLKTNVLKSDIFEDGYSIYLGKKLIGEIGWVNTTIQNKFGIKNTVYYADLNWGVMLEHYFMNTIKYKALPKTQFVRRDFSLLLNKSVQFSDIENIAKKADRKLLKEVGLFDVYEGKNLDKDKKSYAVNFIFQDDENTLKDKVIDKIMDKIKQGLENELAAELR